MATENPGEVFEAIYESGTPGLAGTVAVAIHDNQNVVVFGPTTLQIVELIINGAPTGTYRANLTAPAAEGQYSINWSNDGSFDPQAGGAVEDLLVQNTVLVLPSLGAGVADSALCSAWTTVEETVACCSVQIGSDTSLAEAAVVAASEILYEASGKRYPGVCERTVRPCRTRQCLYGQQVLSRGHLVGWDGSCWGGYDCGCRPTSQVKLAGRAREIVEVVIDGVVLDPSEYYLQDGRWLIRKSPSRWPWCQTIGLPDTEAGTWSVTYSYGKAPPVIGSMAAQALACEIIKTCSTDDADCAIPKGAIRVTRQGITLERTFFMRQLSGARTAATGAKGVFWATGIPEVDYFLNTMNAAGILRRATFWSASQKNRYARSDPS
jgi:hypothetical protein